MAPHLSIFILISIFCIYIPSSSLQTTLELSLTHNIPHLQQSNPETNPHPWMHTINSLASSSITRAHHLKNPNAKSAQIPLFPLGYGGYSVSLSFGTPPQKLPFLMDTGSSPVWVPCTEKYSCSNCEFENVNQTNSPKFIPKLSSSAKLLRCHNKKCRWFFGSKEQIRCNGTVTCPSYEISYALGNTSGAFILDTLDFVEGDVTDFVIGCSTISDRQPSGVVGFGQGPNSLPSQMGVKKFSYCLVSHRYDDTPVSSKLVLVRNSSNSGAVHRGLTYTKFHKMPENSRPSFKEYYYINLQKITVGGKPVKIPNKFLTPDSDGNGGTIIDSGTTYTFMDKHIHNLFAKEFENQMSKYKRMPDVESRTGLAPCFHIVGKHVKYPELIFHFEGGANLSLPLADYFTLVSDSGVLCMTFLLGGLNLTSGPSIIIGNNQQMDIYFEYDLENGRLGFKKQTCK